MGEDKKFFPTITAKVKDLIPYARNSRTHSEEQVTQIASSIREFGIVRFKALSLSIVFPPKH